MYKIIPLQCPPKSHILSTLQYCSPKLYYLNKFTYNVQVKTYLSTSKQMFNKFEDNSYLSTSIQRFNSFQDKSYLSTSIQMFLQIP